MGKSKTTETLANIVGVLRALDAQASALGKNSLAEHVTGFDQPKAHDSSSIRKLICQKAKEWDRQRNAIADSLRTLIQTILADTASAIAEKGVVLVCLGGETKNPIPRSLRDLAEADKDFLIDQLLREANRAQREADKAETEEEFDPDKWAAEALKNYGPDWSDDYAEGC